MAFSSTMTMAAVLTVAVVVFVAAEGQTLDCVNNLLPCAEFLNSTIKPSTNCCNAIRGVVETQLKCICSLYNNPERLPGINMTQALSLSNHCNIPNNLNTCTNGSSSAPQPPPPAPGGVPGTGTGTATGTGSMASWMGMPTLLLVSALITFLY